jgi:hypothetical protein
MNKHSNGLLQRRSTSRLLHVCIVLAVGVEFVSCTKEQKHVAQSAQFSQPVSACPLSGISSTGTPELCVRLTEIQIPSHGAKADVGLSLVNRTGQRLFVTWLGSAALTDSSGRKWNTGESKGLGTPGSPVPLEPGAETQGAMSFSQTGQASQDAIFSLRGEIGIMKMDSHGHVVPDQIAIKRAITLSGIRIHQPPQPLGSLEQRHDTKPVQSSPRRANPPTSTSSTSLKSSAPGAVQGASVNGKANNQKPGSPVASRPPDGGSNPIEAPTGYTMTSKIGMKSVERGGSGPDVLGLRIGMAPDQAREMFKAHGFSSSTKSPNRPFDSYAEVSSTLAFSMSGRPLQPVPHTNYLARISGAINDVKYPATESSGGLLTVFFGPVPGQERIVLLNQTEYIPISRKLTVEAFEKTLVQKYGTPTEMLPDSPGTYRWRYDNNGTLRKPSPATSFVGCPRLRPGNVEFQSPGSLHITQEYKQSKLRCGAIFLEVVVGYEGFNYAGPGTIIKNYSTHITGLDGIIHSLEAAKAIVDKAQTGASVTALKE